MAEVEKSTNQILQALDALSHTLYQARAARRTNSLALPRSAVAKDDAADLDPDAVVPAAEARRPLSRRLSLMTPFRSRPKLDKDEDDDDVDGGDAASVKSQDGGFAAVTPDAAAADAEKKGAWRSWGPIRALSHIGMHRVGCLFSVEVVAAQRLPPSMNGLRLAVAVRKKETREGAVQTMPARVQQGAADFDETLFVRCHLYCTGGGATGKPLAFEPRPFLLSVVAVDAAELDLGRSAVDLSLFAKEFTDMCQKGECPREWDMAFPLAGKAKGGDLVVKLAFQSIDNVGGGVYSHPAGADKTNSSSSLSSFARKLSKSSFSIMLTPKMTRTAPSLPPKDIDSFKLDEPAPAAEVVKEEEDDIKKLQQKATEAVKEEVVRKEVQQEEVAKEEAVKELQMKEEAVVEDVKDLQQEEDVKQQEQQHEPEREPEPEDAKSDEPEVPEFDVVDKGIEDKEPKDELKEEAAAENGDELQEEASSAYDGVVEAATPNQVVDAIEPPKLDDVPDAAAEVVEQGEDVAGEPLQQTEQGEDREATVETPPPPPRRIGWRTIAMVVTPIAVLVSRTLAAAR